MTCTLMVSFPHRLVYAYNSRLPAALGLTEEVERLGLKGNKKKKGKKLDEDWTVSLT